MASPLALDFVKGTCKIGHGAQCCRYLVAGGAGFECAKLTELRPVIDRRVAGMAAQGDNCDGRL